MVGYQCYCHCHICSQFTFTFSSHNKITWSWFWSPHFCHLLFVVLFLITGRRSISDSFRMPGCRCAVSSCPNADRKNYVSPVTNVKPMFHRFPSRPAILKLWLKACNIREGEINLKSSRVCSDHFSDTDYERSFQYAELLNPGASARKRNLKPDAVPSLHIVSGNKSQRKTVQPYVGEMLNLPSTSTSNNNDSRKKRMQKRDQKKLVESLIDQSSFQKTSQDVFDYRIFLNGRCIFCLDIPDPSTSKEVGMKKNRELRDFTDIWPYIQPKWNDNPMPQFIFSYNGNDNNDCSEIPSMCSACLQQVLKMSDYMWRIAALKQELKKMESEASILGAEIQKKTNDSPEQSSDLRTYASRYKTLLVDLVKAKTSSKVMSNTIVFLNQLRGCAIADLPEAEPSKQKATSKVPSSVEKSINLRILTSNASSELEEDEDELKVEPKSEDEAEQYEDEEPMEFINLDSESDFSILNENTTSIGQEKLQMVTSTPVVVQTQPIIISTISAIENPREIPIPVQAIPTVPSQMCEVCGVHIPLDNIYVHMYSHVGDFAFKCPYRSCNYTFLTQRSMGFLKHKLESRVCWNAGADKVLGHRYYFCEECTVSNFSGERGFVSHLNEHETREEKNFLCPLQPCGEAFTIKQSLEVHLHNVHNYGTAGKSQSKPQKRRRQSKES